MHSSPGLMLGFGCNRCQTRSCPFSLPVFRCGAAYRRMVWVGRDLERSSSPTLLQWSGTSSTRWTLAETVQDFAFSFPFILSRIGEMMLALAL